MERFHQTLKHWLTAQPAAHTISELQAQLDTFRVQYNQHHPHRALNRHTPSHAYQATPKALLTSGRDSHYRLRYDTVDKTGRISLRRAGRMHHLGIGTTHRGKRVLALIDQTTVTIVHLDTGQIIATNTIDPNHGYWRNTQREPGRWPGSRQ
ncbi:MAG: integrase core domain-containing protein [Propionibacteriaceae bacterium]|nr:integrase core domain-containing protein [Propionibacteriaceae bacterium]